MSDNAQAIESLIVRLTGDGSSYQKMMQEAQEASKRTAGVVEVHTKRIEDLTNHLKGFGRTVLGFFTGLGFSSSLKGAFDQFSAFERNSIRLKSAIEGNHGVVDVLVAKYNKLADTLVKTTLITKGEVLGLFQKVEMMGISGDAAERIVQTSIALAGATDQETASVLRGVIAMERGNYQMLSRTIPALRGIKDEGEKVAKINALIAQGQAVNAAVYDSASGRVERLGRSLKALSLELGGMVAKFVLPVVEGIQKLADWFKSLDPIIKTVTVSIIGSVLGYQTLLPILGKVAGFLGNTFGILKHGAGVVLNFLNPIYLLKTGFLGLVSAGSAAVRMIISLGSVSRVAAIGMMILRGALNAVSLVLKGLGIGIVIALIAIIVEKLGGIRKIWDTVAGAAGGAWDYIKKKTKDFLDWAEPMIKAFIGFASAAWETLTAVASSAYDFMASIWEKIVDVAKWAWRTIVGDSEITWDQVRLAISIAFIAGEFAIRHFGDIAELTWVRTKLGFVRFVNEVEYFFMVVVPTTLRWFKDNWWEILKAAFTFAVDGFVAMGNVISDFFSSIDWAGMWEGFKEGAKRAIIAVVDGIKAIPDLVKGVADRGLALFIDTPEQGAAAGIQVGRAAANAIRDQLNNIHRGPGIAPLIIPPRIPGEIEQRLQREFDALNGALGERWREFRDRRLREIYQKDPKAEDKAEEGGKREGGAWMHGVEKEVHKIEAVLRYSAEAFSRVHAFREKILEESRAGRATGGPGGGREAPVGAAPAVVDRPIAPGAPAAPVLNDANRMIVQLLGTSNVLLRQIKDKPPITVVGVALNAN